MATQEIANLLAASQAVLRMLENNGTGKLAQTPPAIALREAMDQMGQPYLTFAEELDKDRERLLEELSRPH